MITSNEIIIEKWVEAAFDRRTTALSGLIAGLPPSNSQRQASSMAANPSLESRVYALCAVSQEHAIGGDPHAALSLALAGMRFCMRCFEQYGTGEADTFVFGVGQFAADVHRILDRLDRHPEQVAHINEAISWLQTNWASQKSITDLRFLRIEALIEFGALEDAQIALAEEAAKGGENHYLYEILKQRLADRLIESTKLRDQRSGEEKAGEERKRTLRNAIESISLISPEFGAMFHQLRQQLEKEPDTLGPKESIERANRFYENAAGFMDQLAGGAGGQHSLNAAIQRASMVLADERLGKDPAEIGPVRQRLEQVRQQALDRGFTDTAEDTLWPLYLCYNRVGDRRQAIITLQEIREHVRRHREHIKDPLKRAGVAQKYPYLHVTLCAQLIEASDDAEALSVIEEAKGRALTDMLAIETGQEHLPWQSIPAAEWLPQYMVGVEAHYLSFLMDVDCTFAVLAAKDGSLHASIIPIGEKILLPIRRALDPTNWGKRETMYKRYPDDIPQRLSPLLSWLEPLVKEGLITEGDHLCYAPEGLLHLVPLQYIDFRGVPFVKLCSLSRYHCAVMLRHATQHPPSTPRSCVAVDVPTVEDTEKPDKVDQLHRVPDWLVKHSGATVLKHTEADIPSLARQPLREAIVHFATHGVFPDYQSPEGKNPYYHSGLLLSHNSHLPQRNNLMIGLLSPERIMQPGNPFNFKGSHVTMQACVSGLAEEGAGGDALGLEWSLLMVGAHSILSTHWNVKASTAADFCLRFYDNWLNKRLTRAQAWREAMLSMMDQTAPFKGKNVDQWAPFTLCGDWR